MKQILPILSLLFAGLAAAQVTAPTNLQAGAISETQINLNWTDNASNEVGYQVWMSRDGSSYSQLAVIDTPDSVRYSAIALLPSTDYWWKVRAYAKGGGQSQYSNVATATTFAKPSPTATPTPTATATPTATPPISTPTPTPTPSTSPSPSSTPTPGTTRTVKVTVVNPVPGEIYQISYGTTKGIYSDAAPIPAGQSSVDIPNLTVGTTYYFAGRTLKAGLVSDIGAAVSYTVTSATTQELKMP